MLSRIHRWNNIFDSSFIWLPNRGFFVIENIWEIFENKGYKFNIWFWMWRSERIWYLKRRNFYDLCWVHLMVFWHWHQRTNCSKDMKCVRHVGFRLISSERDWRIIPGLTWISYNYAAKTGCCWNCFSIASSCGILYKRCWTSGFCYHGLVTSDYEDVWLVHITECKFSDRQWRQIILFTSCDVSFFLIAR